MSVNRNSLLDVADVFEARLLIQCCVEFLRAWWKRKIDKVYLKWALHCRRKQVQGGGGKMARKLVIARRRDANVRWKIALFLLFSIKKSPQYYKRFPLWSLSSIRFSSSGGDLENNFPLFTGKRIDTDSFLLIFQRSALQIYRWNRRHF